MDTTDQLPTVLSLCTGYGGIERGLELAGFKHRVLAHVEIETFAIANLVNKMETGQMDAAPVWSNLKTLPVDCFRDRVDVITGGYPCQPFSAAGRRQGKDDPRHLWPFIRDIIESVRPVRCFFENVEGHISLGLREVIEDLEGLGYQTTWGIFSASEVGAPHQRKRVYILADSTSSRLSTRERANVPPHAQKSSTRVQPQPQRCGEDLADTNSKRQRWRPEENGWQTRASIERLGESNLADTISEGSQGGIYRRKDQERKSQFRYIGCSGAVHEQQGQELWATEPELGRVADGIANRVDRLRLLGNGVVPQTAAKAWTVLEAQLDRS